MLPQVERPTRREGSHATAIASADATKPAAPAHSAHGEAALAVRLSPGEEVRPAVGSLAEEATEWLQEIAR